ncbi:MAG: hypothetical protein RR533_02710 [Carnobacterium sp.]
MKDYLKFPLDIQLFGEDTPPETPPVPTTEPTVSKKMLDKALSELAQAKKDLKAKMTDEEAQALALSEKEAELQLLRDENKKTKMIAGLSKSGIDENSITKISDMAINADTDGLAQAINEAISLKNAELSKELEKLKLESTKRPNGGDNSGDKDFTKEDFKKMTLDEKMALKEKDEKKYYSLKG